MWQARKVRKKKSEGDMWGKKEKKEMKGTS